MLIQILPPTPLQQAVAIHLTPAVQLLQFLSSPPAPSFFYTRCPHAATTRLLIGASAADRRRTGRRRKSKTPAQSFSAESEGGRFVAFFPRSCEVKKETQPQPEARRSSDTLLTVFPPPPGGEQESRKHSTASPLASALR